MIPSTPPLSHLCMYNLAICSIPAHMPALGGHRNSVNLRTLDLASLGLDVKELTGPGVGSYFEGLRSTHEMSKDEPFAGGAW